MDLEKLRLLVKAPLGPETPERPVSRFDRLRPTYISQHKRGRHGIRIPFGITAVLSNFSLPATVSSLITWRPRTNPRFQLLVERVTNAGAAEGVRQIFALALMP
jgi:hypothetical protein